MEEKSKAAREKLSLAIAARDAASERVAAAVLAQSNAKELVDAGESAFHTFDGLDAEIIAYRAEAIEAWSAGRGDGLDVTGMAVFEALDDLSEELSDRVRGRQEVQNRLLAAKAALSSLSDKRAAAQRDFAAADSSVQIAAHDVILVDVEAVADDLKRAQAAADVLRFRLKGFLSIQQLGTPRPMPRLGELQELAAFPREPFFSPAGTETARWQAYHQRLINDSNSVL